MEVVNVTYLGTATDEQTYSASDKALISSNFINTEFGQPDDYIEFFVYDLNNEIIYRSYTNNNYQIGSNANPVNGLTAQVTLDPAKDVQRGGVTRGSVVTQYNFYRRMLASEAGRRFWIKEISPSRTEIKATRQDISNTELSTAFDVFSATLAGSNYYPDFYINFGDNVEVLGVNAVYLEEDDVAYVIFKLYEPLPADFDVKTEFWVVQKVAEPARFQVDIEVEAESTQQQLNLRGPNYDIDIAQSIGQTTPYHNYTNLFTTSVQSSLQQVKSYLDDEAVGINVDYTDFSNFIHFSSATERIKNFVYKLGLIENYEASMQPLLQLPPGSVTTQIVNTSTNILLQNIDNIIKKFDPYEYYLYYSSASTAWPKSNEIEPYTLYSVTSSQAIEWLGSIDTVPTPTTLSILYSASLYDNTNSDGLRYTAPTYIRDDEANEPYLVFLDMIGQHFDNIWLYYKDLSNRYSADNNPNTGISLDVVAEALKGFGIQLYTNTNLSNNIYYSLLGIGNEGSTLPLTSSQYAQIDLANSSLYPLVGEDWLSSSVYLPPFENEKLNRYITTFKVAQSGTTSSFDQLSPTQVEQEVYKRIYHNLPYLLKTKGTERGVRALIACYGIPNSILTINEYGGANVYEQIDIQGVQDNKIYTASRAELSAKVLTPFTTIQEYTNDRSVNSPTIEIAFSPADSINADITSSLPNLSIQQLIGDPALQYSNSYGLLTEVANAYFKANYTKGYNVWDFIRVIKFYNNSLFKMLKDFVPARASLASGIVIKPHILERSKYERHEPTVTTSSLGDDIKMVSISGSDPDQIKYSTAYTEYVQTPLGTAAINHTYSAEKYTGEFSGSSILVTDGEALSQLDYSYLPASGTIVGEINRGALFQNVTSSVKSTRFLDLDYSSDVVTPVNYGLITQSIDAGQAALDNPYAPFAQLQDYNYSLRRSILPRYEGSKTKSLLYNEYTAPVSGGYEGDSSYGLSAAIDRNSIQFATVKNIPSLPKNFPDKTTIALRNLVNSDSTTIELNSANENIFDIQNIFKAGDNVVVSISDLEKPSDQRLLNGTKPIYRSGYRFDPLIYRENGESIKFEYTKNYIVVTGSYEIKVTNEFDYAINGYAGFVPAPPPAFFLEQGSTTSAANIAPGADWQQLPNSYNFWEAGVLLPEDSVVANTFTTKNFWRYRAATATNKLLGLPTREFNRVTFPQNYPTRVLGFGRQGVYTLNIPTFNDTEYAGGINTEEPKTAWQQQLVGSNTSTTTQYNPFYYKVPRTGQYEVEGFFKLAGGNINDYRYPKFLEKQEGQLTWINEITEYAMTWPDGATSTCDYKVFGVLEKTKTPNNDSSWQYIASTRLEGETSADQPALFKEPTPVTIKHPRFEWSSNVNANGRYILFNIPGGSVYYSYWGGQGKWPTFDALKIPTVQNSIEINRDTNIIKMNGTGVSVNGAFGWYENEYPASVGPYKKEFKYPVYWSAIARLKDPTAGDLNSAASNKFNIQLEVDDYVRFQLYIMDLGGSQKSSYLSQFLVGASIYKGEGDAAGPISPGWHQSTAPAFFRIKNITSKSTKNDYTVRYDSNDATNAGILFQATGSQIVFTTASSTALFLSESIFKPNLTSSTAQNYTAVVDPLVPRVGDLVRFGSFTTPQLITYATIIDTVTSTYNPTYGPPIEPSMFSNVSLRRDYNPSNPTNDLYGFAIMSMEFNSTTYPTEEARRAVLNRILSVIKVGSLVSIKGTIWVGNTPIQVESNVTPGLGEILITGINPYLQGTVNFIEFAVTNFDLDIIRTSLAIPDNTPPDPKKQIWIQGNPGSVEGPTVIVQALYASTTINLDTNIGDLGDSANFAILRPREDETSIVVDYAKQPGEVATTLLIPSDLSEEVATQVSNIAESITQL